MEELKVHQNGVQESRVKLAKETTYSVQTTFHVEIDGKAFRLIFLMTDNPGQIPIEWREKAYQSEDGQGFLVCVPR